jgi:uncharacterized protein YfiM (DUF2279 family)
MIFATTHAMVRVMICPIGRLAPAVAMLVSSGIAPAARAGGDRWLGRDKALHFGATLVISGGSYAAASAMTQSRAARVAVALLAALAVGAAKEGYDALEYGDSSFRDLAWDGMGAVTGAAVAWGIDTWLRGSPSPEPFVPQEPVTAYALRSLFWTDPHPLLGLDYVHVPGTGGAPCRVIANSSP